MQLGQFLRQLTRLTEEFGIAVVLTNQVVADPGGKLRLCVHDISTWVQTWCVCVCLYVCACACVRLFVYVYVYVCVCVYVRSVVCVCMLAIVDFSWCIQS